ncbi:TIR domain-containing adapter molecule 2-like [Haliotis cracherodii]|uniref:TIR domain-containing adapter molecule 2-like n=1 Tax=Haliotis cracherodii TaxID=6455 RepID=UPI0039E836FF
MATPRGDYSGDLSGDLSVDSSVDPEDNRLQAGGDVSTSDIYDFVVFYSESDREEAFKITKRLERQGRFRGYLDDRDGKAGSTVIQNLDFALGNCKAYIMLLSESFFQCNFQTFAMHTGLHNSVLDTSITNRLLPLLVDIDFNRMPASLRIIQGIPYQAENEYFWGKLEKSLNHICNT